MAGVKHCGPRLDIASLPRPPRHREGIRELRPWQASCLALPGVMPLDGEQHAAHTDQPPCNLVFSGG